MPGARKTRNTRRENRLEELGRVDAEKAYTSKGKRNLRDEKHRIRLSISDSPRHPKKLQSYKKGGHVKSRGKALRGGGAEIK